MGWEQSLRRLNWLRGPSAVERAVDSERCLRAVPRSASLCIASGKGGTGKSVVTASLGELFSSRGRTLIVDADMGVGNAHILQDVSPPHSFVDVVQGRCSVADARVACSPRLDLIGAGSGVSQMAALSGYELHVIARGLLELEAEYDFVIVDSAAGISEQTLHFACACDAVVVVTTPDLTAMTDGYAFMKVLHARRPDLQPMLVVNRAANELEHDPEQHAERVVERLSQVCHKFLGNAPRFVGAVPEDRNVVRSVAARRPVVRFAPGAPAAHGLQVISRAVLAELAQLPRRGVGRALGDVVGYVAPNS